MGGWGCTRDDLSCRLFGMLVVLAAVIPETTQAQSSSRPSQMPAASTACRFETATEGTVSTVVDGRSFMLTDGREIRLAGIEIPTLRLGPVSSPPDAGHAAKAKLESILAGATVSLSRGRPAGDRYGRTIAYVDVIVDGLPRAVAAAMVSSGY